MKLYHNLSNRRSSYSVFGPPKCFACIMSNDLGTEERRYSGKERVFTAEFVAAIIR